MQQQDGYVYEQLLRVGAETALVYWRSYDRKYAGIDNDWELTPFPDGKDYWEVSNYEYIAYTPTHVFVWVVYDCYSAWFHKVPLFTSGLTSDYSSVEAG